MRRLLEIRQSKPFPIGRIPREGGRQYIGSGKSRYRDLHYCLCVQRPGSHHLPISYRCTSRLPPAVRHYDGYCAVAASHAMSIGPQAPVAFSLNPLIPGINLYSIPSMPYIINYHLSHTLITRVLSYGQTKHDIDIFVRGLRIAFKISQTHPLSSQLEHTPSQYPELDHELFKKSDEELREVVRERIETLYHPTCTCRMAPLEDKGVVDSKLRVYGIQGLRVCDASIYTKIISGHTVRLPFLLEELLIEIHVHRLARALLQLRSCPILSRRSCTQQVGRKDNEMREGPRTM